MPYYATASAARSNSTSSSTNNSRPTRPTLKPSTLSNITNALEGSEEQKTRRRYLADIKQFFDWATQEGIKVTETQSVHEETLCAFAASLCGHRAGGTVRAKMSNIKKWHNRRELGWCGGEKLRQVLKGVDRKAPPSSRRPPRKPVTRDMLEELATDLNPQNNRDVAVLAIATSAFYGQLRLGEITPDSDLQTKFDANTHPTIKNISTPITSEGSVTLHLPSTKTTGPIGADVTITRQRDTSTDPIQALNRHIRKNGLTRDNPISSYKGIDGTTLILTRQSFLLRCNEIWSNRGRARYTGHSFRIGGTTFFLLARVHPDVVKACGRWNSDSFLRYWRQVELLASDNLENLVPPSDLRIRA